VEKDIRLVAGQAINLLSVADELKLVAQRGKVSLQAQHNDMALYADKNFKIISSQDRIEIAAHKEILITCGGAYIRLAKGDIEIHAPGKVDSKGSSCSVSGPASMTYDARSYHPGHDEMFVVRNSSGQPVAGYKYKLVRDDGAVFYGVT